MITNPTEQVTPTEGVVIEVVNDKDTIRINEGSEICFQATVFSKDFEEVNEQPISWNAIGLCIQSMDDNDRPLSYVPGQSGCDLCSDGLVELVDELYSNGVFVRSVELSTDNKMLLYIALEPMEDRGMYELQYNGIWTQTIQAIGKAGQKNKLRHPVACYLPNYKEGKCIISYIN